MRQDGRHHRRASDEVVETMSEWGLMLGLCFQIMDDVIDLRSDTATLGKTSGSDISSGKRTIIALHALSSGKAMPAFEAAYGNEDATEEMIAAAVSDLEESGASVRLEEGARVPRGRTSGPDRIDESDSLKVLRTITDFQMARIQ